MTAGSDKRRMQKVQKSHPMMIPTDFTRGWAHTLVNDYQSAPRIERFEDTAMYAHEELVYYFEICPFCRFNTGYLFQLK